MHAIGPQIFPLDGLGKHTSRNSNRMSCFRVVPKRLRQAEIMDEPGLDEFRHSHALRGLARLNVLSRSVSNGVAADSATGTMPRS